MGPDESIEDAPRYRPWMSLAIAIVFELQRFIAVHKPYGLAHLLRVGDLDLAKKWLGILVCLLFATVLVEHAWAFVPRSAGRSYVRLESAYYLIDTLFLLGDLRGRVVSRVSSGVPLAAVGDGRRRDDARPVGLSPVQGADDKQRQADQAGTTCGNSPATAVGYCVVLFLRHRTFSHDCLPVMAAVVCSSYE